MLIKTKSVQIIATKKKQDDSFFSRLSELYNEKKLAILKDRITRFDLDNSFLILYNKHSDDIDKFKIEVDKIFIKRELFLVDLLEIIELK